MPSNSELFGDDDSSSDDDEQQQETTNKDPPAGSQEGSSKADTSAAAAAANKEPDAAAAVADSVGKDDDDAADAAAASAAKDVDAAASMKDSSPEKSSPGGGGGGAKEDDGDEKQNSLSQEDNKKKEISSSALKDSTDDDDSDDEPEFDDQGANIVGLKSSTLAGSKAMKQQQGRMDIDRDDEDGFGNRAADLEQPAAGPPPTLVVQEVPTRPGDSVELHMTKLPNLVGIQTEAFDPDTYFAAQEEQDFGQASYNLMRWRYKKTVSGELLRDSDGRLQRESNTKIVEWEDGSYTLHVGNETFQVDTIDSSNAASSFPGLNGYLYLSQTASYKKQPDDNNDDDQEEEEEPAGTVLECMGSIRSRLTIRPSSLQSEAHKSLTVGIRQKTIKKARIAEFVTEMDPEKLKQEKIKIKQDLEKGKKAGARASYARTAGGGGRRPRMSRNYLEGEDEDDRNFDTTNLRSMKRRTMGGHYDEAEALDDYGDDDSDDDDDDDAHRTFRKVKPGKKKKKQQEESDDEEEETFFGAGDDDDDDEEVAPVVRANKKRSHQAVLDDDDESD